ncbi:hypothetical protein C2E23DRAFT_857631 [Lenzites betulinus]|nr:hypothetical protein C2E23DRAFT_857631 [Lenzites betulinus]
MAHTLSIDLAITATPDKPGIPLCTICKSPCALKCAFCDDGPAFCSQQHFRQIQGYILDANKSAGFFDNVKCYTAALDGFTPKSIPDPSLFLRDGYGVLIQHFDENKVLLSEPFHYLYCLRSFQHRLNRSHSIAALVAEVAGGRPDQWITWPGSLVVMKFKDTRCEEYVDMTEGDIRHIQMFFYMYGVWR